MEWVCFVFVAYATSSVVRDGNIFGTGIRAASERESAIRAIQQPTIPLDGVE